MPSSSMAHRRFSPLRLLDRRNSRPCAPTSSSSVQHSAPQSPSLLLFEGNCPTFLEEKPIENKEKRRTLVPRAQFVYGELNSPGVTLDVSKEACADHSICEMSKEEQDTCKLLKEKWNADKARGVHFPSVPKVRRKELLTTLEMARNANTEITPRPARRVQSKTIAPDKCKKCALSLPVVPPGLKRSDWLPLIYLRRARRCERQRPSMEGAANARTILLNRFLQRNEPRMAVWTNGRSGSFYPRPSHLSKEAHCTTEHLRITDNETSNREDRKLSVLNDNPRASTISEDLESQTDSSSEYSVQSDTTSERSPPELGVHQDVEIRELQWVKRYRTPKFPPSSQDGQKTLLTEIIPEEGDTHEENEQSPSTYNFNKPLPSLPSSSL